MTDATLFVVATVIKVTVAILFLLILLKDDCCSSFFFNDTVKNDCLDIFKVTTVTKWLLQVRVRVPNRSLTRYIISKERCMLLILEVLYTELAQIMMRCCAFCMENITYHVREGSPPEALNWCNSLGILQARGEGGGGHWWQLLLFPHHYIYFRSWSNINYPQYGTTSIYTLCIVCKCFLLLYNTWHIFLVTSKNNQSIFVLLHTYYSTSVSSMCFWHSFNNVKKM